MEKDRDIVLFKTSDETVNLPVSIQDETVWLNKELTCSPKTKPIEMLVTIC
jgi:hypothetical protein